MNKLPANFELGRYGLHVRLVCEEDAEFIVTIRTNAHNAKYIHDTDVSVEAQRDWIRNYKIREVAGEEYYLLFELNGVPQGVYRIYNRHENWCVTGSWVFSPKADRFSAIKGFVITHEVVFDVLEHRFVHDIDGVNLQNKQVLGVMKLIGGKFLDIRQDPKGQYQTLDIYKEDFYANRDLLLRMVGVETK